MSRAKVEVLQGLLKISTESTASAAAKVEGANRMRQTKEGKAHPLWLLGHLAHGLNLFLVQWVGGKESVLPGPYAKAFSPDFAGGAPISSEEGDYPAWDEVLENYKKASVEALQVLDGLQDSDLATEVTACPEQFKDIFGTNEKAMSVSVIHDTHHRGQLALLANIGE